MSKLLFSRYEAAKLLGISVPFLDILLKEGKVSSTRIGSRVLFTLKALEQIAKEGARL